MPPASQQTLGKGVFLTASGEKKSHAGVLDLNLFINPLGVKNGFSMLTEGDLLLNIHKSQTEFHSTIKYLLIERCDFCFDEMIEGKGD